MYVNFLVEYDCRSSKQYLFDCVPLQWKSMYYHPEVARKNMHHYMHDVEIFIYQIMHYLLVRQSPRLRYVGYVI